MRVTLCFAVLALGCCADAFNVYWNIDPVKCTKAGIDFDTDRFGILHNTNNEFRGSKINIFYRPGKFPNYNKYYRMTNGGIPQRGSMKRHLKQFAKEMKSCQNPEFDGISCLDFEDYLPEYNLFLKDPYQNETDAHIQRLHPTWSTEQVKAEAKKTFDDKAKHYFKNLIEANTKYAPNALVGYYHYPYCKNTRKPYLACRDDIMALNDRLQDVIFSPSTALFPRAYTFQPHGDMHLNHVKTALREAHRVNKNNVPIIPYFWYRYKLEDKYQHDSKAIAVLWEVRTQGDGMILWGSVKNLKNKATCEKFNTYFTNFLGPFAKCFADMESTQVAAINAKFPVVNMKETASKEQLKALVAHLRDHCGITHVAYPDNKCVGKGTCGHVV